MTTQPERDRLAARVLADEDFVREVEQSPEYRAMRLSVHAVSSNPLSVTYEFERVGDTVPPRTFANVRAWGAVWRVVGWTMLLSALAIALFVAWALAQPPVVDAPTVLESDRGF